MLENKPWTLKLCFTTRRTQELPQMSPNVQAPVVQTLDSTIHRIKVYPMDNAIGFPNTYPLDSDLSGG